MRSCLATQMLSMVLLAGCGQAPLRPDAVSLPDGGYVALAHYGTNPVIDTEEQAVVRIGLSADRASWAIVHHYLSRGASPPPEAVRVEDCITAMAPAPRSSSRSSSVTTSIAPSPFRAGWHTLVIAVSAASNGPAPAPHDAEAAPLLVLTTEPTGPLERALSERGAELIVGDLGALAAHLERARRIALVSDGAGFGGPDAQGALLRMLASFSQDHGGIVSVVARLAPGMHDALLDRLAWAGAGTHEVLIPGEEAALAAQLTRPPGLSNTVAEVRFDARHVGRWRLVGHESRVARPALRAGGGLIARGEGVYLLFELKLAEAAGDVLGAVRISASEATLEVPIERRAADDETLSAHAAVVVIAAFAEKLRGSYWARDVGWDGLERQIGRLRPPALRAELSELAGRARALGREDGAGIEAPVNALRALP